MGAVSKIPDKDNLRNEGFIVAQSLRVQLTTAMEDMVGGVCCRWSVEDLNPRDFDTLRVSANPV